MSLVPADTCDFIKFNNSLKLLLVTAEFQNSADFLFFFQDP